MLMVSKGLEETRHLLCHCGVSKFKRAVEGKIKTKAKDSPNNMFMLVCFEKKYDVCVVKYFESYFEDGFVSSFKFSFCFVSGSRLVLILSA